MRRRSAVNTAALSVFGVLLVGCTIPGMTDDPVDPQPALTVSDDPTTAAPTPDPSTTLESLEGIYEYSDMGTYVDQVSPWMYDWLRDVWPSMPATAWPTIRYVPNGVTGRERCTDYDGGPASYSGDSYEYCWPDQTVYVGQNVLWEFYSLTGDAGPAMGIAHEFGHHLQYWLEVDPPYTAAQSVIFENQADCLAGAWAQYVDGRGGLELPDDLEDIDQLFPLIASAEGSDRDHGTESEREEHFYNGFDSGPEACDVEVG